MIDHISLKNSILVLLFDVGLVIMRFLGVLAKFSIAISDCIANSSLL